MATVWWNPNSIATAQVATILVTGVTAGGTLSATINGKSVTYVCVTGDTTTTAATGWFALLSASTAPPEFQELTWTNSTAATIVGTAAVQGTPFTLSKSQVTSTCTLTQTTANASPSDVGLAANWNRAGTAAIPQNGDDVIVADSAISLLWNLTALAAVQFATFQRWQSFTGTIGLPEWNPNNYVEYRPTYFQFIGSATTLPMTLGLGAGNGPSRERYDTLTKRTALAVLASGSPVDAYAVRLLNVHVSSTASVLGTSVAVAMLPGEVSTIASASVDGGGTLALGPVVTIAGAVTAYSGNVILYCAPGSVTVQNNVQLFIGSTGLTYAAISATSNCTISYVSNSTVTALTLANGSTFDNSTNLSALTITNATMDGTCQILDPNSKITYSNAVVVTGQVQTGIITFTGSRSVLIT